MECQVGYGPTGREGLVSSEERDPDVLPFPCHAIPSTLCSQSGKALDAAGYP